MDKKPSAASAAQQAEEALSLPANFSQESERVVCAALMRTIDDLGDKTLHAKLTGLLAIDDLYVEQHQALWSVGCALLTAGLPADAVAINDTAARQGLFVGGAPYLAGLLEDPLTRSSTSESILQAAARIKELSMVRRLQASLRQALALCEGGNEFARVCSFVEDDMVNLRKASQSSRTGPKQIITHIDAVLAQMQAQLDGERAVEGIPTGFEQFDHLTGGLVPETLIVLAARPAMGKTAYALNIAERVAVQSRRPVLIFSLEMTGAALARRTLASNSRVRLGDIKNASLTEQEWSAFMESVEVLRGSEIFIDDTPGLTMSEIRARSRAFITDNPEGAIMLDYMQLVAPEEKGKKFQDENSHIGEVSKALKLMARELRCPVLALAQLNRELEKRANKRPMMSDLRGSGQIEQDAEIIVFLYRDEVYNPDSPEKGVTESIIAKNRDGETRTIKNAFEGAIQRFTELGATESFGD